MNQKLDKQVDGQLGGEQLNTQTLQSRK